MVTEYTSFVGTQMKRKDNQYLSRAANGQYFTKEEVKDFKLKSTTCCPTYGACDMCHGSGPVQMYFQKCRNPWQGYRIVHHMGTMKIIDAEWVSQFFEATHFVARADRTQNWPTQKMWNMDAGQIQVYMRCRWPGKHTMVAFPNYWIKKTELFMNGIDAEEPGEWDMNDHPVEILNIANEDVYWGS
jgi:hypothetical protein